MLPATSQLSGKAISSNRSRISPSHLFWQSATSSSSSKAFPIACNLHRPSCRVLGFPTVARHIAARAASGRPWQAIFAPPRTGTWSVMYLFRGEGRRGREGRNQDLMATRVATCVCGQLTASCSGDPTSVSLCHCLQCQRRTGSTYGIAAFFARENVTVAGDSEAYARGSDSGYPVTFYFCPRCGSTVYWKPARKPEMVAVAVGAFADPAFPAPSQAVYAEHRHRWVPNVPAS